MHERGPDDPETDTLVPSNLHLALLRPDHADVRSTDVRTWYDHIQLG